MPLVVVIHVNLLRQIIVYFNSMGTILSIRFFDKTIHIVVYAAAVWPVKMRCSFRLGEKFVKFYSCFFQPDVVRYGQGKR